MHKNYLIEPSSRLPYKGKRVGKQKREEQYMDDLLVVSCSGHIGNYEGTGEATLHDHCALFRRTPLAMLHKLEEVRTGYTEGLKD